MESENHVDESWGRKTIEEHTQDIKGEPDDLEFKQAYCDLPEAAQSCNDACSFFRKEFNLPEENIINL